MGRISKPVAQPENLIIRCTDHLKYWTSYLLPQYVFAFPKRWKIHPVFHVSLIEPFVKGNRDVDLNAILKTSDPIENAPEYDVDKVIGSTEKDGKVLYLVKWKGWPAKKHWTREPFDSFYSVGAKEELRVFHSKNPDTLRDSRLTDSE
jgi:hypothetical protein